MIQVRYLFVVFVSLITLLTVSAKTHHVIGGDDEWRVSSSGRVFRVGDKISLTEENIVEVESLEDFTSCNVVNPIRIYTDNDHHITLEKEGIRYFTSANPENCKNGLKLPVHVLPIPSDADHSFEPFGPEPPTEHGPTPPFEPWPKPFPPPHVPVTPPHFPDTPPPFWPEPPTKHGPPPFEPWPKPFPPPHVPVTPPPYVPLSPPPHFPDTPPPHVPHSPPPPSPPPPHVPHSPPPPSPPPPHVPHSPPPPPPFVPHSPPPPPVAPSASTHSNGFSFVLFAAMALCYIGQL